MWAQMQWMGIVGIAKALEISSKKAWKEEPEDQDQRQTRGRQRGKEVVL